MERGVARAMILQGPPYLIVLCWIGHYDLLLIRDLADNLCFL